MWPGTGRRGRRIVALTMDPSLHTSGAAARAAAWRPPPAASRRSHRHEIGSPVVIFRKIGKELASWPFCARFSEKARREIRNRDDTGLKRWKRHPSAMRPRFVLVRQGEAIFAVGKRRACSSSACREDRQAARRERPCRGRFAL